MSRNHDEKKRAMSRKMLRTRYVDCSPAARALSDYWFEPFVGA